MRIIGGTFRGRRLRYDGDPVVRPMKHRTREAIFNLVSTESEGRHAIDLFAGTGALGLEALSRGALSATFIEKHIPSARMVGENIRTLAVEDRAVLLKTSAFLWAKRDLASEATAPPFDIPWLVFCSPPYSFFVDRLEEMRDLVERIQQHAPAESALVVEGDERLDLRLLQHASSEDVLSQRPAAAVVESTDETPAGWNVRYYPPAVVGIWRKL